jgi:hypothetical protein
MDSSRSLSRQGLRMTKSVALLDSVVPSIRTSVRKLRTTGRLPPGNPCLPECILHFIDKCAGRPLPPRHTHTSVLQSPSHQAFRRFLQNRFTNRKISILQSDVLFIVLCKFFLKFFEIKTDNLRESNLRAKVERQRLDHLSEARLISGE